MVNRFLVNEVIKQKYGNRVRARVCGLCAQEGQLLMVNHRGLAQGDFWAPPGGGIELSEPAEESLIREFREETGLNVRVKNYLFVCEFIGLPLHTLELFFEVECLGGDLKTGRDPETDDKDQIITDVRFLSWAEINSIDSRFLHGLFRLVHSPAQIFDLRGYFKL